jgi:hypothetical protein
MVIKEAELLFQAGALQVPVIKHNDVLQGWLVTLPGTHQLNPMLETARGGVRVFKLLDAAVGVLFELGIEKINIVK